MIELSTVNSKRAGVRKGRKLLLSKDLPLTRPLLTGRLLYEEGCRNFDVIVSCPYCHSEHVHGWPLPPFPYDAVFRRAAHCENESPLNLGGYWIGLGIDPPNRRHNLEVIDRAVAFVETGEHDPYRRPVR